MTIAISTTLFSCNKLKKKQYEVANKTKAKNTTYRMTDLKRLIKENDTWTNAEGENDGTIFLLRFRPHLEHFIKTKKFNKRLTIFWQYESGNKSLLPSETEMSLMENVENVLVKALERDAQSVLAFVYTGQNQREWHWYSADIKETALRLNKALAEFNKLPIELSSTDDPDWSEYNAVLEGAKE